MSKIRSKDRVAGMWLLAVALALPVAVLGVEPRVAGFEDLALEGAAVQAYGGLGGGAYWNGSDGSGGFSSGGAEFANSYNAEWMSWSGWSYSTTTDTVTGGYDNQYSAYPGAAAEGQVFAVAYIAFAPVAIRLPAGWRAPVSLQVSNTTLAALAMQDGLFGARAFGPGDEFTLSITASDTQGAELAVELVVHLGDFRTEASPGVMDFWQTVPLEAFGAEVAELRFALASTDNDPVWGMNTPAYFALDNLVLGPTPSWRGYDRRADGWVDTGDWLGWVHPAQGDYVYVLALEQYVLLPDSGAAGEGAWGYVFR